MGDKATLKVVLREQGHERIKSILKQLARKAVRWLLAWRKLSEGDLFPPFLFFPSRARNRKWLAESCFKMLITRAWGETG